MMSSFVGTDKQFFQQPFRQKEPNAPPSDVVLSNKIRFFGQTLRKMENLSIMAISQVSIWFVFGEMRVKWLILELLDVSSYFF